MKVLLVGEGPHEVGRRDYWCDRTSSYVDLEGWLHTLTRRIRSNDQLDIMAITRLSLQIQQRDRKALHPLPPGHGAKALLAKRQALVGQYDLLIFMSDADSNSRARYREIVSEISAGFEKLAGPVACVACVPMSASESWFLSDPAAWNAFAGYTGPLPPHPERIWGQRDDPDGNHPHRYFRRVCEAAGVIDDRATRENLAQMSALGTLRNRCPTSFVNFMDSLLAA